MFWSIKTNFKPNCAYLKPMPGSRFRLLCCFAIFRQHDFAEFTLLCWLLFIKLGQTRPRRTNGSNQYFLLLHFLKFSSHTQTALSLLQNSQKNWFNSVLLCIYKTFDNNSCSFRQLFVHFIYSTRIHLLFLWFAIISSFVSKSALQFSITFYSLRLEAFLLPRS